MERAYSFEELHGVLRRFGCVESPCEVIPWGDGHIHATFRANFGPGESRLARPLLLQALNTQIFADIEGLMRNVQALTQYGRAKLNSQGVEDLDRRMLTLLPSDTGEVLVWHAGTAWRCYLFIENASAFNRVTSEQQAHVSGRAFGGFTRLFHDFDVHSLAPTIPDFHDTPKRFLNLCAAADEDAFSRTGAVQAELEFVARRESQMGFVMQGLKSGELPLRVTHNDTKVNNLLLDDQSAEAVCVIDLDTVMPGSPLVDFGDLVRTSVADAAEDELDLQRVHARPEIFRGLVSGFTHAEGALLNAAERALLYESGLLITLEIGMRFLTDHLSGDVYFGAARAGHNLDRARVQFAIVKSLEEQAGELRRIAQQA